MAAGKRYSLPFTETSHPDDPIPREPTNVTQYTISPQTAESDVDSRSPRSTPESLTWSDSNDSDAPSTPTTEPQVDEVVEDFKGLSSGSVNFNGQKDKKRRGSTTLFSQSPEDLKRLLGDGETSTQLISKCCGGGCCVLKALPADPSAPVSDPVVVPQNPAFYALKIDMGRLSLDTELTDVAPMPNTHVSILPLSKEQKKQEYESQVHKMPPNFVQPHPPYNVFSAALFGARELTKKGAEKRTYHFDIDVTDYPNEGGVDFKVGGAIGVCPPNSDAMVDSVFDVLGVPRNIRDRPIILKTETGRWPTIWGDDMAREVVTTRRELLTWCSDIQSTPPTKALLRLMAEHADAKNEKKILTYLCSAQGQAAFCDLRTGPHITVEQLLHAFPSSRPPIDALFSVLPQLMPRFYSLSNDPHISSEREGLAGRRLIEMAVTVHEAPNWRDNVRTGVGSGFLERIALKYIEAEQSGIDPAVLDLRIPMFRGLMANPLSREFISDGPMMLIGAGVGMAPFRGFILNRLKNANCANKIWLVQGVRDSNLDELYRGELGSHEKDIKKVVQSRRRQSKSLQKLPSVEEVSNSEGEQEKASNREKRYVQDEVRAQADIVWFVANALDGRVFVCGSSKGMGEGVEKALVDVAMDKGNLNEEQAKEFWKAKKEGGQYIAETW